MMVFYTSGAFMLMFLYWKKSMSWRYKKHSHSKPFLEHDLALHTVMISNIPSSVPSLLMTNMLREVFTQIFSADKVIMTRASPILNDLY